MSRPAGTTKRFCCRGHDTKLVGRYPSSTCRECQRIDTSHYRIRKNGLPAERIIKLTHTTGNAALMWMVYRGTTWEAGLRSAERLFSRQPLTIDQADRWCIAIGSSLSITYPEAYGLDRRGKG